MDQERIGQKMHDVTLYLNTSCTLLHIMHLEFRDAIKRRSRSEESAVDTVDIKMDIFVTMQFLMFD